MKTEMNRRDILGMAMACFALTACAQTGKPQSTRALKGMGMVVEYRLAPGASEKQGVSAITDAGNEAFGKALLTQRGGGTSSIGGGTNMSFPRWVRVTWREGMTANLAPYITGRIVGDYKVEVLSRIPDEVFNYVAAAPGRVIVLKFRIKDDGVLFAWAVQEASIRGSVWVYKMQGGDF